MIEILTRMLLIMFPLYIANSSAMLFGGGKPVDFGRKHKDGRRVLGGGKTIRGSALGIFFGTFTAYIILSYFPHEARMNIGQYYLLYGFLLSFGAVFGDMAASYWKRRKGIERGMPVFPLDQLDFVAGGVGLGLIVFVPGIVEFVLLCILTVIFHKLINFIAYKIRMKKVPW